MFEKKKSSVAGVRMFVATLCLCGFMQLCNALYPTCNVTQDPHQTTYSISDPSHVFDEKATGCQYSWANTSDYVVADHMDKIPLVTLNSITSLVASECLGNMTLTRRCLSEGKDYIVSCTTICRGNDHALHVLQIGVIVSCIALFVLVAGLIFLCYKNKCKRKCSCMQTGGLYNPVKMQGEAPAAVP